MSHVRKLLFTRRKSNQNGVSSVLNKSGQVSRALGRGALIWLCARAKGICGHPLFILLFGDGGVVGFLIRTVSESALTPTLCLISWATTKILSPTTLRAGRIDSYGQAIDLELAESKTHH